MIWRKRRERAAQLDLLSTRATADIKQAVDELDAALRELHQALERTVRTGVDDDNA